MKLFFRFFSCIIVLLFFQLASSAQPVLNYISKVTGLNFPVDIVNAGDGSGRLFIVEQGGLIKLFNGTTTTTFLDLTSLVPFPVSGEERGVLSMAFHPAYDGVSNRYFFVYYTTTGTDVTTIRVARYQTQTGNFNLGDPSSAVEVIAIAKPPDQESHNGGKLNFGADGMLYFGTGDGGGNNDPFNLAQSGNSLLGKMLRININGSTTGTPFYSIPSDNPYAASGDNIRDEIWAFGLRNPFRWSFDAVTNAMWIGDVGQGLREEVNVRLQAPTTGVVNYGWRCYEGTVQPPTGIPACNPLPANYVAPIYEYTHNAATGGFSITGGIVYRGTLYPSMYGYYIFADYVTGNVWVMNQSGNVTQQTMDRSNVAGFGTDESGELYAVARGSSAGAGIIYNITAAAGAALPVSLTSFTGRTYTGYHELQWSTSYEQNADKYIIEYSTDGSNFIVAGEVAAMNQLSGFNYSYRHVTNSTGKIYYRLQMIDIDASSRFSSVINLGSKTSADVKIYTTLVQNNRLELNAFVPVERLKVYNIGGKEMYNSNLNGRQGYFSVHLPGLARGIYFINIVGKDYSKTEKIIIQ